MSEKDHHLANTETNKIIAFCGIDGAGKSSLINKLEQENAVLGAKYVRKSNKRNLNLVKGYVRRSTGTSKDWYEGEFAQSAAFAWALDFLEHYRDEIEPLANNHHGPVISDRYSYCALAQGLFTKCAIPVESLLHSVHGAKCVIHIDVPYEIAEQRYSMRHTRSEHESCDVMTRFAEAYDQIYTMHNVPVHRVSNTGTFEDAYAAVVSAVTNLMIK